MEASVRFINALWIRKIQLLLLSLNAIQLFCWIAPSKPLIISLINLDKQIDMKRLHNSRLLSGKNETDVSASFQLLQCETLHNLVSAASV